MTISYEIHPAIGIARLGNSDEFFIGPEPDYPDAAFYQPQPVMRAQRTAPPQEYRDNGKLKRQAARFRVFECDRDPNANGKLLSARELRPAEARITWTVRLANSKGAAPKFTDHVHRRNKTEPPQNVVIAPPVRTLAGANQPKVDFPGKFLDQDVLLGHALTDDKGRLLVMGGNGISGAVPPTTAIGSFADNDKWYDDTSDGPVTASLTLLPSNQVIGVDKIAPAWVVVGPFDFAPQIDSFITLYDVAYQAAVDKNQLPLPQPYQTDFERDVYPILKRTRGYRWVNGPSMRAETQDRHTAWRDKMGILADPNPANIEGQRWRKALFAHLPDPADPDDVAKQKREVEMPRLFNHDQQLDSNGVGKTLPLTPVQYAHLRNWADSKFVTATPIQPEFLCDALDRVALEACSGGAFYPGMEVPRIVRNKNIYAVPFRFRLKPNADPLNPSDPDAPAFDGLAPGQVTAGLAVPWQADFYECQMERDNAWWPATRPDHVLLVEPGRAVDSQSEDMKRWDAGVTSRREMVDHWHQLGIVKKMPARQPNPQKVGADVEVDPAAGTMKYYFYLEDERDNQILPRP